MDLIMAGITLFMPVIYGFGILLGLVFSPTATHLHD